MSNIERPSISGIILKAPHINKSYKSRWKLELFAIVCSFGWVNVGMATNLLNAATNEATFNLMWPKNMIDIRSSLSSTTLFIATVITFFVCGALFSKSSRRIQLIAADLAMIAGTILSVNSKFIILLVGRFLVGISYGLTSLVTNIYIREMSPPEISGALGAWTRKAFAFGILITFAMAFGLPTSPHEHSLYWLFMFLTPIVFSLARLFAIVFVYKSDSPKYYAIHKNDNRAIEVIQDIYEEYIVNDVYKGLTHEVNHEKSISLRAIMKTYKRQLVTGLFIGIMTPLTGNDVINLYSTQILTGGQEVATTSKDVIIDRVINTIIGLVKLISYFAVGFLVDKYGKKKLFRVGNIITCIFLYLLAVSELLHWDMPSKASSILITIGICLSFSVLSPIYLSEVLPAKGVSFIYIVTYLFISVTVFMFPLLRELSPIGQSLGFFVFAFFATMSIPGIEKLVKETKGLTMDEIYYLFNPTESVESPLKLLEAQEEE